MIKETLSVVVIAAALSPSILHAQGFEVETRPVRGFMPNMDQLSSPVDHVDPVSRKLHLEIPIASLPAGRGGTGFDLNLVYDSHLWELPAEVIDPPPQLVNEPPIIGNRLYPATGGGWSFNIFNVGFDFENRIKEDAFWPQCNTGVNRIYRLRVRSLDGSLHVMHLKGYGEELSDVYYGDGYFPIDHTGRSHCYYNETFSWSQALTGWLTYFSDDGSYLKLEIYADGSGNPFNQPWNLYFPDGRRISGPQMQMFDANGNLIASLLYICVDQPTCTQYYQAIRDDVGHEIRIETATSNSFPVTTTITADGPNGPITTTINWELAHLGADQRKYLRGQTWWDTSWPLDSYLVTVKYIQLPLAPAVPANLSPPVWNSYAFGYALDEDGGYGEVDMMRIPSGATFRYRYELEGFSMPGAEAVAAYNQLRERRVQQDGQSDLVWTYHTENGTGTYAYTTITNPDSSVSTYWFAPPAAYLEPGTTGSSSELVYRIDEPNGVVRKRVWAENRTAPYGGFLAHFQNAWVRAETMTVGNAAGNPALTAVTQRVVDKNGNLLQTTEYDWVGYNPNGPETGVTPKRITDWTYHASVPQFNNNATNDPKAYWNSHFSPLTLGEPRRLDAVRRKQVRDGNGTVVAITEFDYDDAFRSGNVTATKNWDNVKAGSPPGLGQLNSANSQVLTRSYGAYGNLSDIYEPEVRTHITYDGSGSYPTRVDYAYQTPAQRSWAYDWNTSSGTLLSKTDLDNNVATSFSYDTVGRQTIANEAGLRKTEMVYDDANLMVTVKKDLVTFGDGKLQVVTQYDQLGRASLTRSSEPGNPDGIKVRTSYYPMLNRTVSSSPYRTTADSTLEWTCTQTDASKRVTAVAMFKGSTEPTDCESTANRTGITRTTYDSNWTSVIDAAGKHRAEARNSLGNLEQVVEDPGGLDYHTYYGYDTLGNLVQVNQGAQTRSFQYSSLGRLTSASNPESGTINYSYLDSGLLQTRTDARGIVASFGYDAMRRIQTKNYSDGTPTATYEYYLAGSGSPKVGQLFSVSSSAAWTHNDGYDAMGRVTSSSHMVSGDPITRSFAYTYWLNNSPKTVTNPSGRVIQYDVDDAGRILKVHAGAATYADLTVSNAPFTADGRIAQIKLGNNLWETRSYQTPGTPTLFKLGTVAGANDRLELEYNFSSTANNGNLESHVIRQPGRTWTQTYDYDQLNRLLSASEAGGWSNSYGYDQYGNRWVSASSGLQWSDSHEPGFQSNFDATTNRIGVAGSTFDVAGNQTTFAPWTLGYDGDNRQISLSSASNGNVLYSYDGDGRRVKKTWTPSGGTPVTTYFVYNALGQLAAEYSTQSPSASTSYVHTDILGSTRMVTNAAGAVLECYDYLPFGRLLSNGVNARDTGCYPPNPDAQIDTKLPQKFTGKERDTETRLDYFQARYLSGSQARFLSADPLPLMAQKVIDPQQWNMYSYVRNNPLRLIDPTGLYVCAGTEKECKEFEKQRQDALKSKNGGVRRGAEFYGRLGDEDGVTVRFGTPEQGRAGTAEAQLEINPRDTSKFRANVEIVIKKALSGLDLRDAIVHEGTHGADAREFAATATLDGHYDLSKNLTKFQTEINAYGVSAALRNERGSTVTLGTCPDSPCTIGFGVNAGQTVRNILRYLVNPANGYNKFVDASGLEGAVQGPKLIQELSRRQFPAITTPAPR